MSHTSTYKQKVSDINVLKQVCDDLGYKMVVFDKPTNVSLYGSNQVKAIAAIKLPDWRYDIAVNEKGELFYDNFGSNRQTSMQTLGKVLQSHNEKVITNEFWKTGIGENAYTEQMSGGKIKLVLEISE